MNPYLKKSVLLLMWTGAAVYMLWAALSSRSLRHKRVVRNIEIEVSDSSSQGHLVSSQKVGKWLKQSGIPTVGMPFEQVDLQAIEDLVARNGFADRVMAYISHYGTLHIEIRQHRPLLRLLTDGVNSYVTAEGYVFESPPSSSLYVPVITGSYRPPFPSDYHGSVEHYVKKQVAQIERQIADLDTLKYPYYRRTRSNVKKLREIRQMSISFVARIFYGAERKGKLYAALRKKKESMRKACRYEARLIAEGLAAVERRQNDCRERQKKLVKSYEDFVKLLNFVEKVENDDFWRSELVQIVVRTAHSGSPELELVPRSGRHIILFGRLENIDRKFDKLLCFYRKGLSRTGWDRYRYIDVRYHNQVVCRK